MKGNPYSNAAYITLRDYIPAELFRTVLQEQLELPHGRSEVLVKMELARKSPDEISFLPDAYGDAMFVYGFVRSNANVDNQFTGAMADDYPKRKITLHDWKDRFLVLFENGSQTAERAYFVTSEEVKTLMANCRHASV